MKINVPGFNKDSIKKGLNFLKYNGVDGVVSQVRYKMSGPGLAYNNWYKEKHEASEAVVALQRVTKLAYEPLISIVVPVYKTPEPFLRAMIESVLAQSYDKWQLCIVDGSCGDTRPHDADMDDEADIDTYANATLGNIYGDTGETESNNGLYAQASGGEGYAVYDTERIIREYMEKDERICYRLMEENLGIADNTNVGIDMAKGSYIAFLEHDDVLSKDALYSVAEALQDERYELIYSDEDKMSDDGSKYSDPAFKPDFSIDLLRSYNYIHRFLVVSKKLALSVGCMRREYEGGQAYDFILRCVEHTRSIKHIPRVLYHYRINNRSTAGIKNRNKAEVEKKALAAHIKRCGLYATLGVSEINGIYRINYETPGNPYISIVIPGGKSVDALDRLLRPLFELARYSNFEIIIVDSDGTDDEMLKYYHRMERIRRNISVVVDKDAESLPNMRNFGAARAKGEYLLFLDSNLELVSASAIGDMLGVCMREDVGIVTGTMYNDHNSVYSQGYVVGINGIYDRLYKGVKKGAFGYLMQNRMNKNVSAVPARCMMVRKALYDEIGGFYECFTNEYAAVDFCLRVRKLGLQIVCVADAMWSIHMANRYEPLKKSVIKPNDEASDTNALDEYFDSKTEEEIFEDAWHDILEAGDPFYNINFARDGELFSLE